MSSVETGKMSAVETGQMSAAETGQMSSAETRQMSTGQTGRCPVSPILPEMGPQSSPGPENRTPGFSLAIFLPLG